MRGSMRGLAGAALLATAALASRAAAQAAAAPDSLVDRAAREVAAGRPIAAAFEQTLTPAGGGSVKTSRGEFAQQGAGRFAFRFVEPAGDAIVADGTALWIYLPSSAPGQVLKLPIAEGTRLDLITQLLTAPRASYSIAAGGIEQMGGRGVGVYRLIPKLADAPFTRATIWLDTTTALVRQLEAVEPSGAIRRIRFGDVRPDAVLPPGALKFTLPPNVRVVDASPLLGGRRP